MNWRRSKRSMSNGNCVEAASYRTSSFSHMNGNCVEAGSYRKSKRSMNNGNCVETGHGPGVVGVRDTKLGESSPVLEFSTEAWRAMVQGIKNGTLLAG